MADDNPFKNVELPEALANEGDTVEVGQVEVASKTAYKRHMVVTSVLPFDTYRVRNLRRGGRGGRTTTAHISQMKIYRGQGKELNDQSDDGASSDE